MRSEERNEADEKVIDLSRRSILSAITVLCLVVVATAAGVIYQHMQLANARVDINNLRNDMGAVRQSIATSETRLRQSFDALKAELVTSREQTLKSVNQARMTARRQAEALVTKATVNHEAKQKELAAEVSRLRDSTEQATARLSDIGSQVGVVKSDVGDVKLQVATTRTELDRTIADMRRVTGDMGVMSGLIATNSKEIAVLRSLGERDYYEFSLSKSQARRLLAGVSLIYKKADPKRNRFTLYIVADDKRVEKKDRTVNEPVQFYIPSRARQPFELVINEVKKDTLIGYLSVPKPQLAAQR
jgi:hypothetical protein